MDIGIGVSDITPQLGIEMTGYYYRRTAEGVHDRLHAKAILFDDGRTRAALISCDICSFTEEAVAAVKEKLSQLQFISFDSIILCATHTHTGPAVTPGYIPVLAEGVRDSLQKAHQDLSPGELNCGVATLEGMFFNRRYFMKDGSVVTNPGKCNPDILKPAGPPATEIPFVRLDRKGRKTWILVNVPTHPDTIAGSLISADYPYFIELGLKEKLKDLAGIVYTNGTSGDINHWDVKDASPQRGFPEAERIGRAVAAAVAVRLLKAEKIPVLTIKAVAGKVRLPYISVTREEIAQAKETMEKPYPKGVDFTLEAVNAKKVLKASRLSGRYYETDIVVFGLGNLALVGVPAEIFVELGNGIKNASPFKTTILNDLSFVCAGYIATEKAYRQGGYEVVSNIFKPETGKILADAIVALLHSGENSGVPQDGHQKGKTI